jgi:Outer membrane protein beta-barrel domain
MPFEIKLSRLTGAAVRHCIHSHTRNVTSPLFWVLSFLSIAPGAHAAEEFRGSYLGADLVYLKFDSHFPCRADLCHPGDRYHFHFSLNFDQGPNVDLFYGYHFNRYWGVEGGVLYVGSQGGTDTSTVSNDETDLTYVLIPRLSVRFDWPVFHDFNLFARYSVGRIFSQYYNSWQPATINVAEGFHGPSVGMEYLLSKFGYPRAGLRLTAVPHTKGSETSFSAYSLGLLYRF